MKITPSTRTAIAVAEAACRLPWWLSRISPDISFEVTAMEDQPVRTADMSYRTFRVELMNLRSKIEAVLDITIVRDAQPSDIWNRAFIKFSSPDSNVHNATQELFAQCTEAVWTVHNGNHLARSNSLRPAELDWSNEFVRKHPAN